MSEWSSLRNLLGPPRSVYIKAYRVGHTEISVGEPQNLRKPFTPAGTAQA